jgi:replicative DNA helicase
MDLDPEAAFLGAVLHLPLPQAREALGRVQDDDLADLVHQQIAAVARTLVADGLPPDPAAVLARARSRGVVTHADEVRQFAGRLIDLHMSVPVPASWAFYAIAVLDGALRRRCIELAARVHQAAEGAPLDTLVSVLDDECRAVRGVLDRRAAADAETAPARLRAVSA